MTKLILDLGNTRDKLGIFAGNELVSLHTTGNIETSFLRQFVDTDTPSAAILSETGAPRDDLNEFLREHMQVVRLDHTAVLPFENHYKTPQTLGRDRLAVLAGARAHYKRESVLVIDAGTCITIDALDEQNRYYGGIISPGIRMRLEAMHTLTARLPLVDFDKGELPLPLTGSSTRNSLLSGAVNGALFETRAVIEHYRAKYAGLKVLLTGGDAPLFETLLKSGIFAFPNLVLEGLNQILDNNVAQTA